MKKNCFKFNYMEENIIEYSVTIRASSCVYASLKK